MGVMTQYQRSSWINTDRSDLLVRDDEKDRRRWRGEEDGEKERERGEERDGVSEARGSDGVSE